MSSIKLEDYDNLSIALSHAHAVLLNLAVNGEEQEQFTMAHMYVLDTIHASIAFIEQAQKAIEIPLPDKMMGR
jgi:hypothetical protein